MLMRVLNLILEMPSFSASEIARVLQVETGIVEQVLEQLKRMGYIREDTINECGFQCKTCVGCHLGKSLRPIRGLSITAKGSELLDRNRPLSMI